MAEAGYILAIDQGTTNSKALLVSADGHVLWSTGKAVAVSYPASGWVEQDANEIWASVLAVIGECTAKIPAASILALGISNQRESFLAWDRKTGEPLGPCITWQCRRTAFICDALRARGLAAWIEERTGLPLDPLFSASKAYWLLANIPNGRSRAEAGEICLGTVDAWLVWRLTGGSVYATDASNASRTQLVSLASADWDRELLDIFDVPRAALPEIRDSSGSFGETIAQGALPAGIPILGVAGDSHAAMFAHAAFEPGSVKATYGTGSSLMTLSQRVNDSGDGLSRTIAWRLGGQVSRALEGNIASTGGTVEWAGRFLGLERPTADAALLAGRQSDAGGVYIVPAFAGLGAPFWDDQARGLICGLSHASTREHLARATVESIAYQVRDVFDRMEAALDQPLIELLADGGASQNDELMQFQADILGRPVVRDQSAMLSGLGAAWLAGLGYGLWKDLSALAALPRAVERFEPKISHENAASLYQGWQEAVQRARLRPSQGGMS